MRFGAVSPSSYAFWFFSGACCFTPLAVDAKLHSGVVKVGSTRGLATQRWKYLSKFTFGPGESTYSARIQVAKGKRPPQDVTLTLEAYRNDKWTLAQLKDPCERAALAELVVDMPLLKNRQWSSWQAGTAQELDKPHIWSFYLSDCRSNMTNQSFRVQYEVQMLQPDGSQLSMEQAWMPQANAATLLGFSAFVWHFGRKCMRFFRENGGLHPVIWTLGTIVGLLYVAQCLRTLHFYVYRSNGKGLISMEVLSEVLFVFGQMTQAALFILIGLGYTLLQTKLGELDVVLPVAAVVAMAHMILVLIGRYAGDRPDKFHEHEGIVGWIMSALQCTLYVWFLWAARSTGAEGGIRLEVFLKQFAVAGTLYFLAYPALLLALPVFSPYARASVMSAGQTMFQVASNVYLTSLFLERNSAYFKVSSLNSSLLPGGVRVGVDKEE